MAQLGFSFVWAIENFDHALEETGDYIASPSFKVCDTDKISWSVVLFPRGYDEDFENYISCFLMPTVSFSHEISVAFELNVISADGQNIETENFVCIFSPRSFLYTPGTGSDDFLSRKDVVLENRAKYLPEDTLTICCRILKMDSKPVGVRSCFARSRIGVQKTCFVWGIENFSNIKNEEKASIIVKSLSTRMTVFFTNKSLDSEHIRIEIHQSNFCKKTVSRCRISLLDANGECVDYKTDERFSTSATDKVWKFPDFITKSKLLSNKDLYLPFDVLTLRCELSISVGVIDSIIEDYGKGLVKTLTATDTFHIGNLVQSVDAHTLTNDLQELLKNKIQCDVSLRVGSSTIPAHKSILIARSPVFRAMFEKEMKESRKSVVDITDLDEDTIRSMLLFIYTDRVEELQWKETLNLYSASDKYDIPELKRKCSSLLLSNTNQSNIVEVLVLADRHCDRNLQDRALDFMFGREKEILSSDKWDAFINDNGILAARISQQLMLKK